MTKSFTILLLALFLISCSSDDDNGLNNTENANELILGTWKKITETLDGSQVTQNICELQERYSYDTSGNFVELYYGNTNTTEPCGNLAENTGPYSISGIEITFTLGGDAFVQKIQNISSTELVLKEVYIDEEGIAFTYVETYEKINNN
ncbi:lipocalin family protein [Flavobacteriaceae bacterium]|nr:lipocalin family protein [Flavobacteriaceae bacterium]MDB4182900.1 lipocalin family protein [Flavobacteriaceae bacterium]